MSNKVRQLFGSFTFKRANEGGTRSTHTVDPDLFRIRTRLTVDILCQTIRQMLGFRYNAIPDPYDKYSYLKYMIVDADSGGEQTLLQFEEHGPVIMRYEIVETRTNTGYNTRVTSKVVAEPINHVHLQKICTDLLKTQKNLKFVIHEQRVSMYINVNYIPMILDTYDQNYGEFKQMMHDSSMLKDEKCRARMASFMSNVRARREVLERILARDKQHNPIKTVHYVKERTIDLLMCIENMNPLE